MASVVRVLTALTVGATAPESRTMLVPSVASGFTDLADADVTDGCAVIAYVADDGSSTSALAAVEGGWTDHGSPSSGKTSLNTRLFSRIVSGSPPSSWSFTRDNDAAGASAAVVIIAPGEGETLSISDVDVPVAADGTSQSVEVTGVSGASVLVTVHANDSLLTVSSAPAGMDAQTNADGSSHALKVYTQINPGSGTLTKSITWSGTEEMHSAAVLVQASSGGGGPAPGEPALAATATAWDAIRLQVTAGSDTDEINVYRSTTSPVTDEDTLVTTLTPDGEFFDTELDPETEYHYLAIASNEEGDTPGTEDSATTFSDDAVSTFADNDPISFPLDVPAGMRMTTVNLSLGKIIRGTVGLGRAVDFAVVVEDAGDAEIGSDTFEDVGNVDEGTPYQVTLDPPAVGPQELTVTITPTIAAEV